MANLVQGAAILIGTAAVYHAFAFRRAMHEQMRLAVFLTAAFLAAPHVANYDAVLLAMAAILVVSVAAQQGFGAREYVLATLVWLCPLFNPPSAFRIGLLTPVLLLGFIGFLLLQGGTARQSVRYAV